MDKETSFDIIRRYCFEDNTIELTGKQKEQLDRWNLVIELRTCEQLETKDIIQRLMKKFSIERATAFNDILFAKSLYRYNSNLSKRDKIGARIEFIEEYIDDLRAKGEHAAAAAQERNLTKWYELYPEKTPDRKGKLTFVYNPSPNDRDEILPVEEAEFILLQAVKNG